MKRKHFLGLVLMFFIVWQLITWYTIPSNELQKGFTKHLSEQAGGSDRNIDKSSTSDKRIQFLIKE